MTEWKKRAADFGFDLGDLTRWSGCADTTSRWWIGPISTDASSDSPTDTEPSVAAIWWLRWLRPRWAVPRWATSNQLQSS